MTQTVPAVVALGPAHTGESVGYRILNLDRTTDTAFTTASVAENADIAGTYYVTDGVSAPDAGGYIIWGVSGTDYVEGTIEPAAAAAPTAEAIADQVWDEALSGHTTAGSSGKAVADVETDVTAVLADTNELQTDDVPGLIAALNDLSAAEVNAEVDTALSDYDPPTKAELDSGLAALNDPTAAAVADAVWDELLSGHTDSGSAGEALADAGGIGTGAITFTYTLTSSVDSSPIADAQVWATTDAGGTAVVASGVTDAFGVVTFYLDAGTYYIWRQKSGWDFTNPDTEVVS